MLHDRDFRVRLMILDGVHCCWCCECFEREGNFSASIGTRHRNAALERGIGTRQKRFITGSLDTPERDTRSYRTDCFLHTFFSNLSDISLFPIYSSSLNTTKHVRPALPPPTISAVDRGTPSKPLTHVLSYSQRIVGLSMTDHETKKFKGCILNLLEYLTMLQQCNAVLPVCYSSMT